MRLSLAEWVELKTHEAFRQLGLIIADWPNTCIIVSVFAAIFLGAGVINFKEVNNVRDHFSADTSPSRYEFAVAREFFQELGSPFHVVVAMKAADGGSLLRPKYIDKALEIEDFLQYKLRVMHDDGRKYAYSDFCGAQCETSDSVNIFLTMFKDVRYEKKSSVKLTFPTIDVYGHRIYLANNIFQVQVNNRSKLVEGANLIAINFHAIYANESSEKLMKRWEHAVFEYSLASVNDPLIRLYTTSEGLVSEEVRRTGIKALPLMTVTFLVILTFTVVTSLKADPVKSKPWEAFFGVLCPCLSLCGSFGFLFWLGFEFLPIVTVVPFLILAIGVDDIFIFLHCWSHTDGLDVSLRERVALVLAEAGPSITITSLTNLLSFGIGIFTPTPAIRVFCIFIFVAVLFDYIYQIVLYTALMMVFGRREELRLNAYVPCLRVATIPPPSLRNDTLRANEKCAKADDALDALRRCGASFATRFVDAWVDWSMSWTARMILAVVLCCYWSFSVYGIMQIKVGLTSEKLFLDDSPLLELVRLQTEVIFREGGQMAVFVNNPGDLRRPEAVPEMMKILERFERAPGSVGSSSTQMWLNHYLSFVGIQNRGSIDFNYKYLPEFFANTEFHRWSHFVSMGAAQDCYAERSACVGKFFFSTGFRNAIAWADRLELLQMWRAIAAEYHHYNITIYEDFSMYSDQLLTIPPVTLQTVLFALLCMTLVLILFTPHQSTILPGVAAVMSINLGVFGLLFFWNIDLDPISMTTTLMAIGLSVDFVAHISFHYYKGNFEDRRERLRHALVSIAWPMVQAGMSTILSLLILATVHAYMVQVFVKVVVMVVSLGLIHGLVVLPIVYAFIPFNKHGGATRRSVSNRKRDIAQLRRRESRIAPTKIAVDTSPTRAYVTARNDNAHDEKRAIEYATRRDPSRG